ncbi:MAG: hypothetical protein NTY63_00105 [Candidatus Bipolaricaulota bacterium]|nr:hypothetical protein [Candidatus Bipolaricaulota bacterium]
MRIAGFCLLGVVFVSSLAFWLLRGRSRAGGRYRSSVLWMLWIYGALGVAVLLLGRPDLRALGIGAPIGLGVCIPFVLLRRARSRRSMQRNSGRVPALFSPRGNWEGGALEAFVIFVLVAFGVVGKWPSFASVAAAMLVFGSSLWELAWVLSVEARTGTPLLETSSRE